jgi:hypothetical protein
VGLARAVGPRHRGSGVEGNGLASRRLASPPPNGRRHRARNAEKQAARSSEIVGPAGGDRWQLPSVWWRHARSPPYSDRPDSRSPRVWNGSTTVPRQDTKSGSRRACPCRCGTESSSRPTSISRRALPIRSR